MKFHGTAIVVCAFHASVLSTTAFAPVQAPKGSSVVLRDLPATKNTVGEKNDKVFEVFPKEDLRFQRLEGGKALATFKMPPDTDRCQMYFKTNGRPMRVIAELWLGPTRRTHMMDINVEDGQETPFRSTLKFKKHGLGQVLRVMTTGSAEYPVDVSISVPSKDRAKELLENVETLWKTATPAQKQVMQGGHIVGGPIGKSEGQGGATRTWTVHPAVESVQVIFWSKDVSKKSLKSKIEVYNGPNLLQQVYNLQCGGGSQPYHAIIETPGGGTIKMRNKKFMEDGKYEVVVMPYKIRGSESPASGDTLAYGISAADTPMEGTNANKGPNMDAFRRRSSYHSDGNKREWWE